MIAFHYPPFQGGSGVHRTLKFSKYLPKHDWQPIVLSAQPSAYSNTGSSQLAEIPDDVIVKRAFALDAARHLSFRGRYLRIAAIPDQWSSWWLGGVVSGLRLIRKYRPSIIWSTYPIATAHLIGLTLHKLTGLPWVADFRDSMTEEGYPRDEWSRRAYLWIEKQAIRHASRLVFTTNLTRKMYIERYPDADAGRFVVIPNGFDEEDFSGLDGGTTLSPNGHRPIRLLHAGVIYPDDRDPKAFFKALARLKMDRIIDSSILRVDLRASGSESYFEALISDLKIADIVHLLPSISHRAALEDCSKSNGLLLFQAASCNHQIPAKAYEYLRLAKPILALTPSDGDTAGVLMEAGGATIVDLADEIAIRDAIPDFVARVRDRVHPLPALNCVERYNRRNQTAVLAQCLNSLQNSF